MHVVPLKLESNSSLYNSFSALTNISLIKLKLLFLRIKYNSSKSEQDFISVWLIKVFEMYFPTKREIKCPYNPCPSKTPNKLKFCIPFIFVSII